MEGAALARDLARAQFDGTLITSNDAQYDRLRRVNNGLIDRRPAAIVRAESTADVQKVVRIAAQREALLAVRCGGHSFPGLSTCNDGIVLDLSLMRDVIVDAEARTAEVSGGALLADVDAAGLRYGLVTPAGVVSHTGVGGLTLGGGMGWLSRRFGLTIDSLLGADIVTADGQLVRVGAGHPGWRRQLWRGDQIPVPHASAGAGADRAMDVSGGGSGGRAVAISRSAA
jgi:FAD/FMN-containing dehydrogenase